MIPTESSPKRTNRPTLLIVDDEAGPRESLRYLFKDRYNCVVATCGRDGIGFAREHSVDAAIVDIKMPDLSGIAVLRELKQIDPFIECVMLTGYETIETARAAIRYGAADYLNKPFDVFLIRGLMEKYMAQRRQKLAAEESLQSLRQMNEELSRELARSNQAVTASLLAAGVVHEINNPLMIISGYTELLGEALAKLNSPDENGKEEIQQHLTAIEREIQRCKEITTRFLRFARGQNGGDQPLNVGTLLEDAVALVKAHRANHGTEFFAEISDPGLSVRKHQAEILQILVNLGVNALQAMEGKGRLRFKAGLSVPAVKEYACGVLGEKPAAPMLKISVSDTGCGISAENLQKIFQPYFTTKANGTGIGLAIVAQLVRNQGGLIDVESQAGQGAVFSVFWPWEG